MDVQRLSVDDVAATDIDRIPDTAVDALRDWAIVTGGVIRDPREALQQALKAWCDESV